MSADPRSERRFLPVALSVAGKSCVVVGGGEVGTRKVVTLVGAGADVTVVAPNATDRLRELVSAGRARWVEDRFREVLLDGAFLVVAATNDGAVNATVTREADRRGALVCDASSADRSRLVFGALLDEGDATIAVFTDGRDPSLSRRLRDRIASLLSRQSPSEGP